MAAPGIIFDLDGTLVDTLDDITASLNNTMGSLGLAPLPRAQVAHIVGDGLPTLIARSCHTDNPARIEELVTVFRSHYAEHCLDASKLYPGWETVLDELAALRVPLAVLSNKPHEFTRKICRHLLQRWPFSPVEGHRPEFAPKPAAEQALAICAEMGLNPEDVVMIGDSEVDIGTARAGGLHAVAVDWGFRSRETLTECGPDVLIDRPADLLAIVRSLRAGTHGPPRHAR